MAQRRDTLPPARVLPTRSGHLACIVSGRGQPTLLLFSGAGVVLEGWRALYPQIEQLGTVLAWNRFGLQGSDPPPDRQTGTEVVGTLRELLRAAHLAPPYVLVAHSLGGLYANLFARLHPQDVAAVLLIEATHPEDHELLKKHEEQLVHALKGVTDLPQPLFQPNVQAELASVEDTVRQIAAAGDFPPVPLRVLTGGLTPRGAMLSPAAVAAKRAHQQELARLSPLGEQVIAHQSGHFPQLTQPEVVLGVLRELVGAVRVGVARK